MRQTFVEYLFLVNRFVPRKGGESYFHVLCTTFSRNMSKLELQVYHPWVCAAVCNAINGKMRALQVVICFYLDKKVIYYFRIWAQCVPNFTVEVGRKISEQTGND